MIKQANVKKNSNKEKFVNTDIQSWKHNEKFDYVFSMESLYYVDSIEKELAKIFKILKPGGQCFCGTNFYAENKAMKKWAKIMNV